MAGPKFCPQQGDSSMSAGYDTRRAVIAVAAASGYALSKEVLDVGGSKVGRTDIPKYRSGCGRRRGITAVQGAFQNDRKLCPGDYITRAETVITAASRYSSIRQHWGNEILRRRLPVDDRER